MSFLGYARLVEQLKLSVKPVFPAAQLSGTVSQCTRINGKLLFPHGVALQDTPLGHLEFAIKHEGINLEVIDAAFEHIQPEALVTRLTQTPNGESIRRLCFLWEWLRGSTLNTSASPTGKYIDLFPSDVYFTAQHGERHKTYRITNNALGNAQFCPTVRRDALSGSVPLEKLLEQARQLFYQDHSAAVYQRAIHYLYLSETRSSFAIEKETPSAQKEERFVQLLQRVRDYPQLTEDDLVLLQNAVVRDVYSQEASYRWRQNWLENSLGRVTYFPPPPAELSDLMQGWEAFTNDTQRGIDLLVQAACAAFGFVYLHPFMDGNGRLHRFMFHQVLARHPQLPAEMIVPVSAVIMQNIPAYHEVLTGFSQPITQLWDYRRAEMEPYILKTAPSRSYRFFNADREVAFLHQILQQAIEVEMPREIAWLDAYDEATALLEQRFDLPKKDIATLVRMAWSNNGELSKHRRKQYAHLPDKVLDEIESVVKQTFGIGV
ncbi:Fic family protein [Candidatus Thiothrix anitrata]|uniref:Fic family protein n=1 Tax=Candidatus Thiothrix anitrata TaxID=2823902 RepID=A0ABX7X0A3_9GAMM|nr:Fic family protein [Candidatus Thiothrix anitrata]QTR49389.1 Fic family protein [Candidatus Thiothrix anitrata]